MFGSSGTLSKEDDSALDSSSSLDSQRTPTIPTSSEPGNGGEKRSSEGGSPNRKDDENGAEKKRRGSRARDIFSSAKQSFHLGSSPTSSSPIDSKAQQTPMQKLAKSDPALSVLPGSLNNAAGESVPGPRSTFRVGVTEDKNRKCRRTMEDTHAYLYNFLSTPAPVLGLDSDAKSKLSKTETNSSTVSDGTQQVVETDNGYFAIFDGHAGTFAADWCGKKLHLLLEDTIKRNPNTPIPELLDQTFTTVDTQLEKLPLKNSGCTAVIAVLRWEDRVPNSQSATGSAFFAPAAAAVVKSATEGSNKGTAGEASTGTQNSSDVTTTVSSDPVASEARLRESASRQRVLYTANVGDARIVLCRNGRALRLSYDHKGSDENEGRRVANAGGLILNNRVNGVLAVTRALGDAYMKDLVTGHPYTTETVIQPDSDEFLILACDGLWDVCSDQEAVDLVRHMQDPQAASKQLVDHALARFSTDNLSCMIVRFDNKALKQRREDPTLGVEVEGVKPKGMTETEAIVSQAKKQLESGDSLEKTATPNMIVEEEEDTGPELNVDALKETQQKK
ncbi:PP2C-domain-containing protein [Pseudovirgaria hyperparasitica]|uniref:PP2C-domain-containing protein n=1 Tax=Pseudovirgaria hyperparasitica TaxID=470096 RepID=A0A6A6W8F1_9PEZI|nr:PP2C-domain-containing protein [Pseudovirgaria hyperparasitica]KAF2759158.1 PP2C-domain-containing protein [Pseudovirgaria hyperparasitica]